MISRVSLVSNPTFGNRIDWPLVHSRRAKLIQHYFDRCARCRESYHPHVYEIHHITPASKKFNLSGRDLATHSWDEIMREAAKCCLLCANCHRTIEATRDPEWVVDGHRKKRKLDRVI